MLTKGRITEGILWGKFGVTLKCVSSG